MATNYIKTLSAEMGKIVKIKYNNNAICLLTRLKKTNIIISLEEITRHWHERPRDIFLHNQPSSLLQLISYLEHDQLAMGGLMLVLLSFSWLDQQPKVDQ